MGRGRGDVSVSSADCGWLISGRVVTYLDEVGRQKFREGRFVRSRPSSKCDQWVRGWYKDCWGRYIHLQYDVINKCSLFDSERWIRLSICWPLREPTLSSYSGSPWGNPSLKPLFIPSEWEVIQKQQDFLEPFLWNTLVFTGPSLAGSLCFWNCFDT